MGERMNFAVSILAPNLSLGELEDVVTNWMNSALCGLAGNRLWLISSTEQPIQNECDNYASALEENNTGEENPTVLLQKPLLIRSEPIVLQYPIVYHQVTVTYSVFQWGDDDDDDSIYPSEPYFQDFVDGLITSGQAHVSLPTSEQQEQMQLSVVNKEEETFVWKDPVDTNDVRANTMGETDPSSATTMATGSGAYEGKAGNGLTNALLAILVLVGLFSLFTKRREKAAKMDSGMSEHLELILNRSQR